MLINTILVGVVVFTLIPTIIEASNECPPHPVPVNGYSECSDGRSHKSLCETKCQNGFILKGPSRMICWCRNSGCTWTGMKAKCEKTECEYPDIDTGRLRLADRWEGGFAGIVEFDYVNPPKRNAFGWSVVVVFDRPLGQDVSLMSWNLELTATSFDGQTFTFGNPENKKELSKATDSSKRFSVLMVADKVEGALPESAFAGLYFQPVDDATCVVAPNMPIIIPLYDQTPPTSEAEGTSTISSRTKPRTTASRRVESSTKSQKVISTSVPATTTTATPALTTVAGLSTAPAQNDNNNADVVFCKGQTHYDSFVSDRSWEDRGIHYFGGYFNLVYPRQLSDWRMVVAFPEEIKDIQTWAIQVLESSEDGRIWTFGPHPWDTKFGGSKKEIRYIATQEYATVEPPIGQVFLCSEAFSSGDATIKGSGLGGGAQSLVTSPTPRTPTTPGSPTVVDPEKVGDLKCSNKYPEGIPVTRASQTKPESKKNTDGTKYNYNELLHISLLFYEAQRSGKLPANNRIPWRGDSALKDGCDIKRDLTGGFFDAGDTVKFNFPIAFTITTLAWGGIEFGEAYENAGELENLISTIKWGAEYFIKTHIARNSLVAQVGHGKTDHNYWGRPEEMQVNRPTYVLTEEKPGTELAAEVAAALSASSIFLRKKYPALAEDALAHATEIFDFAVNFRAKYSDSIPDAALYYKSFSGYRDELVWGATWLYKASNDSKYLDMAEKFYGTMGGKHTVGHEFSWDYKLPGAQVLLADITGKEDYRKPLTQFLNRLPQMRKTPQGLYYFADWGTNRYAANAALILIMGNRLEPRLPKRAQYIQWARKQIRLLLGDAGRSYVVGFGKNPPVQAHHGASSCPPYPERCDWTTYHSSKPNHYILYGALVGGPNMKGTYSDDRSVYQESEVACDYNACFQSAIAGLKLFAMEEKVRNANKTKSPSKRSTAKPATRKKDVTTSKSALKLPTTATFPTNVTVEIQQTTVKTTIATTTINPKTCKPKRSKRCIKARRAARKAAAARQKRNKAKKSANR